MIAFYEMSDSFTETLRVITQGDQGTSINFPKRSMVSLFSEPDNRAQCFTTNKHLQAYSELPNDWLL